MGRVFGPVQQLGRPLQAEETAQDFEFPLKPVLNLSSLAMLQMQALQIHDDWVYGCSQSLSLAPEIIMSG